MNTYTHADMLAAFESVKALMNRLNGDGAASYERFKRGMNDAKRFEDANPADERIQLARHWAMGGYQSLLAIAR